MQTGQTIPHADRLPGPEGRMEHKHCQPVHVGEFLITGLLRRAFVPREVSPSTPCVCEGIPMILKRTQMVLTVTKRIQ